MNVHFNKHLARFNLCGDEKQWQVVLYTPYGSVSDLWDEEPELDGLMPTEVLDLLEKRIQHWLFSSTRAEKMAKVAELRAHANDIDTAYAKSRLEAAQKEVKRWGYVLDGLSLEQA